MKFDGSVTYNVLGKTGMNLSKLGIGGAVFSRIYKEFDETECTKVITSALQHGLNYIDTAPWYGQGSSEEILGKALKDIPRQSFYIGTKVGRYELDVKNMFDFSAEKTSYSIDHSLELLGLDYVDIIQVHDITFAPDVSIILKETLPACAKAVADGKARFIGITDYDLDTIKEVIEESTIEISSVLSYAKATLIDNRLQDEIPYFQEKGIGVINAAGNAMGLLTNAGAQEWHPANDETKYICRQAASYCKENGVELARLAQWFTFSQLNITSLSGMQTMQQLEQTLDVLINGLSDNEHRVLQEIQEKFFKNQTYHWDHVELPKYQARLKEAQS